MCVCVWGPALSPRNSIRWFLATTGRSLYIRAVETPPAEIEKFLSPSTHAHTCTPHAPRPRARVFFSPLILRLLFIFLYTLAFCQRACTHERAHGVNKTSRFRDRQWRGPQGALLYMQLLCDLYGCCLCARMRPWITFLADFSVYRCTMCVCFVPG